MASHLLHVSISTVPLSTDGEDAAVVLMAHAEPPPVLVFVVVQDPWHTVQFRLWLERILKAEVGQFCSDSKWQAEMQVAAPAADAEEGEVAAVLKGNPGDSQDDAMAVNELTPPITPQDQSPQPPLLPPVPLNNMTFHFQLYGPFFKIISYKYSANVTFSMLRILPGMNWPLLVGIQAGDWCASPALHDLWAYTDLVPPPVLHVRWPEDGKCCMAGEAEHRWVDTTLKSCESPAAVAQLTLLPCAICKKFSHGLVVIKWGDWSMDKPTMIYLFQFVPMLLQ